MAQKATRDQKEQVITLSQIDSLVTILGDYPEATLPLSMNVNPFGFLLDICKSLGIYDELLLFIVKLIQYELPLIELAVKGILLSNLKELISCSSDPFIPKYMRKKISNTDISSGMTFSLPDIDFNNLMGINPLAQGAEYSYLGISRKYTAHFKIVPKRQTKLAVVKISSLYKDDYTKARDKLIKWKNKYDKKYGIVVDNEGNANCTNEKYSIIERGIEEGTYSETKSKVTTMIKSGKTFCARYIIEEEMEEVEQPKNGEYYVNEEKYFDTYEKAASFIKSRRMINNKYYNPVTWELKDGYFEKSRIDTEVLISPHELARAQDFNAFLWYVCHMANFNDPIKLPLLEGYAVTNQQSLNGKDAWKIMKTSKLQGLENYLKNSFYLTYASNKEENDKEGPLGVFKVKQMVTAEGKADTVHSPSGLLGSVFNVHDTQDSSLYDLCIKVDHTPTTQGAQLEPQDEYTIKTYTIVPATSDNISLNWYGDRGKYFDFLKYWASPNKEKRESPRNYSKEIGICNIEFDTTVNDTSQDTLFHRNKLRFTILPKPLVHIPQWLTRSEWPWKFKMILFDVNGKYSTKGKYSCFVKKENTVNGFEPICYQQTSELKKTHPCYYELANKSNEGQGLFLHIPKHWKESKSKESNLKISTSPTSITNCTEDNTVPPSCLYECYPNLTIYEFNYDYVMSQRLFDPKVITGQLIQSVLNCRLGISGNLNVGITHNITPGTERLVEVIKNMITADTYSSEDCFFQFSNQKYDEMARNTEKKKAQGFQLEGSDRVVNINTDSINKILNEYDNPDLTQEGQVDVLNRAFNEVSASITAETEDTESWDFKFNIIQQLIEDLTFEIVKAILTPKIIMLLMVNKQLLGNILEWKGDALTNIGEILISIVVNIVKEIKDMILSELLEFLLGFLKPKFAELAALIMKEYLEQYRNQIEALIKACGFGWGKQATADTKLDQVDYADIDPVEEVTKDNQC